MKTCKECGIEFEPKNKKGLFCSNKCRQKDYRKNINELVAAAKNGKIISAKIIKENGTHRAEIKIELTEKSEADDKLIQERIKQLEYELAHPPKTFTVSGMKYHYFNERENELKKLKGL